MLRNQVLYLFLLIILAMFYMLYRGSLSLQLLLLAIILPILLFFCLLWQRCSISLQRKWNDHEIPSDSLFYYIVRIRNRCPIPLINVKLTLTFTHSFDTKSETITMHIPIAANNSEQIQFPFSSPYCGRVSIHTQTLTLYDPLCLFRMRIFLKDTTNILLLPPMHPIAEDLISDLSNVEADQYSKEKNGDDPSEIFGIRAYQPGDRCSRFHWKLSAKADDLLVKEYSLPNNDDVVLFPDYRRCGRSMHTAAFLDAVLSAFYAVSCQMHDHGISQRCLLYQSSERHYTELSLQSSADTQQALRQLLCTAPQSQAEPGVISLLCENPRCTSILYFTPSLDAETIPCLCVLAEQFDLIVFYAVAEEAAANLPEGAENLQCIPILCSEERKEWKLDSVHGEEVQP